MEQNCHQVTCSSFILSSLIIRTKNKEGNERKTWEIISHILLSWISPSLPLPSCVFFVLIFQKVVQNKENDGNEIRPQNIRQTLNDWKKQTDVPSPIDHLIISLFLFMLLLPPDLISWCLSLSWWKSDLQSLQSLLQLIFFPLLT